MKYIQSKLIVFITSVLFLIGTGFTDVEQSNKNNKELVSDEMASTEQAVVEYPSIKNKEEVKGKVQEETRTITARGNHGVDWILYDDGEMVFYGGELWGVEVNKNQPSNYWSHRSKVKIITILEPVNIQNGSCSFSYFTNLETFKGEENITFIGKNIPLDSMFAHCVSLQSLNVSTWDTKNVTNMQSMFMYMGNVKELDVSKWNMENVTNISHMFQKCDNLEDLDVSKWNTKNVVYMNHLLPQSKGIYFLDLSNWSTENAKTISCMFPGDLQGKSAINTIVMGLNVNTTSLDTSWSLKEIPVNKSITGRWVGLHSGNIYNTSDTFMAQYDGSKPDTYQWEYLVDVNFDLNYEGANELIPSQRINQASLLDTVQKPKRIGYKFIGWEDETGKLWNFETMKPYEFAKENDYDITYMTQNPINLKAKWEIDEYNIDYVLNAGVNSESNPKKYVAGQGVGEFFDAVKNGYTFLGWYRDELFTDPITKIESDELGNVTLYAKWQANEYPIEYRLENGKNNPNNPEQYIYEVGVEKFEHPIRDGYTFKGWYSDAEFKTEVTSIPKTSAGSITLYAKWERDVEEVGPESPKDEITPTKPETPNSPQVKDDENTTNLPSKEPVFTGENTETFTAVQTGDSTNISTLFILVGLSSLTALFLFFRRKKYSK